jgi:hypothetical protein
LTISAPDIEDGSERTNAVLFMGFIEDFFAAMATWSVHESPHQGPESSWPLRVWALRSGNASRGGTVDIRKKNPISIAVEALNLAEDSHVALPQSPDMRQLHRRMLAMRSVLHGLARDIPRLSADQREKLVRGAMALAREVSEINRPRGRG